MRIGSYIGEDEQGVSVENISVNNSITISYLGSLQTHGPQSNNVTFSLALPPPPPAVFLGYTLPPGHPCNLFTLPPPPADKKRTGPRRKFLPFLFLSFCNSRPYLSNYLMLMMLLSFLRPVQFSLSSMLPSCGGSHSLDAKGPFRFSCS